MIPLRPLWHLGPLHPVEQLLTIVLAFGPFLVLGLVIWRRTKADAAEAAAEEAAAQEVAAQETASAVREEDSEASESSSRTADAGE